MRVSLQLSEWFHPGDKAEPARLDRKFESTFETTMATFLQKEGLLEDASLLTSERYLRRSIAPHVVKLSKLFNRIQEDVNGDTTDETDSKAESGKGVDRYWGRGGNPENLRLAYFLYFMPANAFRVAAVWEELRRYGFKFPQVSEPSRRLKVTEWGAGPGAGAFGLAVAHGLSPDSKQPLDIRLIEQDRRTMDLGVRWLESATSARATGVHTKIDLEKGFSESLPPSARMKSDVFLSSFFLNEFEVDSKIMARALLQEWDDWLEPGGLAILVEPALKIQSRRLLEVRREILAALTPTAPMSKKAAKKSALNYKILLPCLGHQACGALANPEDWCHEEATWWRPNIVRALDKMVGLDRRTLPFSYLVIQKAPLQNTIEEILPALPVAQTDRGLYRLVSPAHGIGPKRAGHFHFFVCGKDGKFKTQGRFPGKTESDLPPERGDVITKLQV